MKKLYFIAGRLSLIFSFLLIYHLGYTQDISLKPVSGSYVLQHVNVIQAPGKVINDVTLVISNGLIQSLGKNISIPPDAVRVKADSMMVYAGFIDGLSHAGIPEPKREEHRTRPENPSHPTNEQAGITPEQDVRDVLHPDDKSISDLRGLGFGIVQTVPRGQMLPGTGSLILLNGEPIDEMVFRDHVSFFSQLDGAHGVYPSTVMGVMAKYRELYKNAQLVMGEQSSYKQGQNGMARPKTDRVLQAFYPVIKGTQPVIFKAESVLDIQRALLLQKNLGFHLMLGGVKQSWDMADQLKQQNIPFFLSLDLPEWKKMEEDTTLSEDKAAELQRLQTRDSVMLYHYYHQGAELSNKNIVYGMSTLDAKPADISKVWKEMIKRGLSEDQLLAALTTQPAAILGLSDIAGTVDAGKMANLVVTDKSYFDEDASVRYVFVDGKFFEYDKKKKKDKKNQDDNVKPEGKWDFKAETGNGTATGVITITGSASTKFSGTLLYNQSGVTYKLNNVSLSGKVLSFDLIVDAGGQTVPVEISMNIDSDSFEGTATAGGSKKYPIEGDRLPEKF